MSQDPAETEDFSEKVLAILNQGTQALMISLGHRTGLFDKMAEMEPATSDEIAKNAGLNERYVREWLGAMVTGRIVEYDPKARKYHLPKNHAAFLTRAAAPNNMAAFAQYISVLGSVEDQIVRCFKEGGGVPYSEFPRFQEVMSEDSGQTVLPALLDSILPLVPGLTEKLSEGIRALDVGCGRGKALMILAKEFPKSEFIGYELGEELVSQNQKEAEAAGLSNLKFEVQDVANLTEGEVFDLITAFDAIHDQVKPDVVLRGIARALKPDGVFLMQDIAGSSDLEKNMDHPMCPMLYAVSTMHCMTVSLAEGGMGLGTMWGEERARRMLKEAGFKDVKVHRLSHDIQNSYFVCRTS